MKNEIFNNLDRLGFHDSNFSDIKIGIDNISIKIDWGFLENYEERNVLEPIVFGNSTLNLLEVQSQVYKKLTDSEPIEITIPETIKTDNWLIMANKFSFMKDLNSVTFKMTNDFQEYIEWTINFKHGKLSWDEFILHKNWLNGQQSLS